jgi:intraflagellar transport protein 172
MLGAPAPCLQVVFYDTNGAEQQTLDYSQDDNVREFSCCTFNPAGDTVVFGTFNRFYTFSLAASSNTWEEVGSKHVRASLALAAAGGGAITRLLQHDSAHALPAA